MHDTEAITPELAGLCTGFLRADPDARGWASVYPDESEWESPDCDDTSERFLRHAKAEGFDGFLVHAESTDEGQHWFTILWSAYVFVVVSRGGPPKAMLDKRGDEEVARFKHRAEQPERPVDNRINGRILSLYENVHRSD